MAINSVYSEDHTKLINILFGQNVNILSVKEEVHITQDRL